METTEQELKRYEELQVFALDFARQGKTERFESYTRSRNASKFVITKVTHIIMLASYNGNLETTSMLIDF